MNDLLAGVSKVEGVEDIGGGRVRYHGAEMVRGWPEKIVEAQKEEFLVCNGKKTKRIKFGSSDEGFGNPQKGESCHDCAVIVGQYHVWGCDVERCPVCHGQLISCPCKIERTKEFK